ncbi:putative GDP-mannose 4,6-dehydratase [Sulfolobus filamentous virus 1]|uniref:GDP-mannose 4,6-dehydratase n=1 Tax=Sulfolobus filamentous virus 1 TaxID=2304198 RepID=A0A346LUA4_SUFV1|nr:nucleotide-sugar epimerase [Sulfolobus filamentous virus 1]AXQ00147.1 putative GDP-mannose 4,6-dehydratase [Sulfolobus filamentous virus 1]
MKALITGITGQDGSFLAKQLLDKGYTVYGIARRTSTSNLWRLKYLGIVDRVNIITADVTDSIALRNIIETADPDEVYHLAGQSHVHVSFNNPQVTFDTNTISTLNLLEAIRQYDKGIKFYFAGSSEMYGNCDSKCNEQTNFNPVSPYGISKLASYHLVKMYRKAYNMFCVNGILFNHESELRGSDFVTRKITIGVAKIVHGLQKELLLGRLAYERDWGYAPEYTEAIYLMMQQKEPDDYVIATGESHMVLDFVKEAFDYVGLKWWHYVYMDEKFYRPLDIEKLVGDYSKAEQKLGWKPKTKFKELVHKMVDFDLMNIKKCLREHDTCESYI